MIEIKKIKKAYTHAGVFHADDVFATAFLKMIVPDVVVERTNMPPGEYGEDVIVYDVGGGAYDHHESMDEKEKREDRTPYAAFGKLWRDFGIHLMGSEEGVKRVDEELVKHLDITDNTGEYNGLSTVISNMNPLWDEDKSSNDAFDEAVALAINILKRFIERTKSEFRGRELVLSSKFEDGVLMLDRFIPWKETVVKEMPDVKFVVYPSIRGGINLQTVPVDMDSRQGRIMFPEEWLGKENRELGITFCHPGNFLLSTETVDQAVNVAHIAMGRF